MQADFGLPAMKNIIMMRLLQIFILALGTLLMSSTMYAGNPDRQGEAGAYQLLMNPWARSAGLHSMNTSFVSGVDAMNLNISGLSYLDRQMQVEVGHTRYLQGAGIGLNTAGLSIPAGENGTYGISLMMVDFGDIPLTTVDDPDYNPDQVFSPTFFNIGVGYAHTFANKVSVGILGRIVSEGISDINALYFSFDTGVQYVAGDQDNFKLGISLRNIGVTGRFSGEGLSTVTSVGGVERTVFTRGADFNLPFTLNLGLSYDFYFVDVHRLTAGVNFTSNAFLKDQIGPLAEYSFKDLFYLRAAYQIPMQQGSESSASDVYTGLAAGLGVSAPLSKETKTRLHINYAYRQTLFFDGTHNIGLGLSF